MTQTPILHHHNMSDLQAACRVLPVDTLKDLLKQTIEVQQWDLLQALSESGRLATLRQQAFSSYDYKVGYPVHELLPLPTWISQQLDSDKFRKATDIEPYATGSNFFGFYKSIEYPGTIAHAACLKILRDQYACVAHMVDEDSHLRLALDTCACRFAASFHDTSFLDAVQLKLQPIESADHRKLAPILLSAGLPSAFDHLPDGALAETMEIEEILGKGKFNHLYSAGELKTLARLFFDRPNDPEYIYELGDAKSYEKFVNQQRSFTSNTFLPCLAQFLQENPQYLHVHDNDLQCKETPTPVYGWSVTAMLHLCSPNIVQSIARDGLVPYPSEGFDKMPEGTLAAKNGSVLEATLHQYWNSNTPEQMGLDPQESLLAIIEHAPNPEDFTHFVAREIRTPEGKHQNLFLCEYAMYLDMPKVLGKLMDLGFSSEKMQAQVSQHTKDNYQPYQEWLQMARAIEARSVASSALSDMGLQRSATAP